MSAVGGVVGDTGVKAMVGRVTAELYGDMINFGIFSSLERKSSQSYDSSAA